MPVGSEGIRGVFVIAIIAIAVALLAPMALELVRGVLVTAKSRIIVLGIVVPGVVVLFVKVWAELVFLKLLAEGDPVFVAVSKRHLADFPIVTVDGSTTPGRVHLDRKSDLELKPGDKKGQYVNLGFAVQSRSRPVCCAEMQDLRVVLLISTMTSAGLPLRSWNISGINAFGDVSTTRVTGNAIRSYFGW